MKVKDPQAPLPLSVAVLMGGESRRFGSPKAFLPYRGKSLGSFLLTEASRFSNDVFAVSRELGQVPPDARKAYPVVMDLWEERGPLSGLHSALLHATNSCLFLRAVDMPFLSREVAEGLYRIWEEERPEAVVPQWEGRWEPLCGLFSRSLIPVLRPGKWESFQSFLSEGPLRVREVGESELRRIDPSLQCLKNFNRPLDWKSVLEGTLPDLG